MDSGVAAHGAGGNRQPPGRRVGYLVAAVFDVVFLWIANHLLDWQWPRFLTVEFDDVLPVLSASIIVSIVVNVIWVAFDPPWFKALGNIITSAFGIAVGVRTLEVFPFDFSTYARDWAGLVRVIVVIAIVGSAVGVIVNLVKLVSSAALGGGDTAAHA
jgi:hypothetical protein